MSSIGVLAGNNIRNWISWLIEETEASLFGSRIKSECDKST